MAKKRTIPSEKSDSLPSECIYLNGEAFTVYWADATLINVAGLPRDIQLPCGVTQVSGIVIHQARILLAKDPQGQFDFPGGKPEAGETPLETLAREVMEETCVIIKMHPPPVLLGAALWAKESKPVAWQLRFLAFADRIERFGLDLKWRAGAGQLGRLFAIAFLIAEEQRA